MVCTTTPFEVTTISWLVGAAGPTPVARVQVTLAAPFRAAAATFVGAAGGAIDTVWYAVHFFVTASLAVQNFSCSMFHSVSTPSPLANRSAAATNALSATVMLPFALRVMV